MTIDYWHIMLLTHLYSSYPINCQVKKIFLQTCYHTHINYIRAPIIETISENELEPTNE